MPQNEINSYICELEPQEIVEEMKFGECGFFSLVMFLRKAGNTEPQCIRKVVDFRLLNAYSHIWKTQFPGTLPTVREIPKD